MSNKYQIPRSRREKIELLSSIAAGKKTIDDLIEKSFAVYLSTKDGNYVNAAGQFFTREEVGPVAYDITLNIT